jgi:AcrR family transcriptional regulator
MPALTLTPKTRRPKRTNEQRSAEMKARLLDATIECLFELGYASTTTTEVCRRADVSRGAQLHHFPTRASLVTAAVELLFDRLHAEFERSIERVPPETSRAEASIDLLWKMVSGKTFHAWLEIVVASRTDAELSASVRRMSGRFGEAIRSTYRRLFPEIHRGDPFLDSIPEFLFSTLEGLALHAIAEPEDGRAERILGLLKLLSNQLGE